MGQMIMCLWRRLLLQLQRLGVDMSARLHVRRRMDLIDARRFHAAIDWEKVAARERERAVSEDIIFPHSAFL